MTDHLITEEGLTENAILSYLKAHPDFLSRHPQLLQELLPPAAPDSNDTVLDFQQHQVSHLQTHLRELKSRYEGLIIASRDNMSTQTQVHRAVLGLMKAHDLESLLQMLRQDLLQLFDVDIVRLALESPVADYYDTHYGEHNYSGISFVDMGVVDVAIGTDDHCRLLGTVAEKMNDGLRQIFDDCSGLVESCALLRLSLPSTKRQALLAFGVRSPNRFHPQQGVELLTFLARIVEYKLDQTLAREGLDEI